MIYIGWGCVTCRNVRRPRDLLLVMILDTGKGEYSCDVDQYLPSVANFTTDMCMIMPKPQ